MWVDLNGFLSTSVVIRRIPQIMGKPDWTLVNFDVCKKCDEERNCCRKKIEAVIDIDSTAMMSLVCDTNSATEIVTCHIVPSDCQFLLEHQVSEDVGKKEIIKRKIIFQ